MMCLSVVEETVTVQTAKRRSEVVDGWKWVGKQGHPGYRRSNPPITERWQKAKPGPYKIGSLGYVPGFHIFLHQGPRPSYITRSCVCVPVRIRGVLARGRQDGQEVAVGLEIRRRRVKE